MRRDGAIIRAIAVLVAPLLSVLIGIGLWKMTTETLFMTSGSLPFESIGRTGSDRDLWRCTIASSLNHADREHGSFPGGS
jgi:hypothetical protein